MDQKPTFWMAENQHVQVAKKRHLAMSVDIYIYTPYQKLLWIEQFSINFEGSFVIVTDKHDRTYACSINNIKKVRSTDLKSDDQSEESFSSYKPNDEFWSPKEHDINEQEEDWSDF